MAADLCRYSLNINNATLESLLTNLPDEVSVPEDDRDMKRAVSVVGKNINSRGEAIWCLNRSLALDREGDVVNCEDYGLEWVSHLTDGDGKVIAKREMASVGERPTTTKYFDDMCHFLSKDLEDKCSLDPSMKVFVNELFEEDPTLGFGRQEYTGRPICSASHDRENFLSQFYLASMGVVMANFDEVCTHVNQVYIGCK